MNVFQSFGGYFFMRLAVGSGLLCCSGAAIAAGTPRDSNFGNTSDYADTAVRAWLNVEVKSDIEKIHFIRDNNDPRVVTKAYVLRHADPYELRGYLRTIVQTRRVGNTALYQQPPTVATNPSSLSEITPRTPANAQPTYAPELQLGSNTGVECLKYTDGTGVLLISAEEYCFGKQEHGLGIDELVAKLDLPNIKSLSGQPDFLYFPKNVPALNLKPLIENVGLNRKDATELWQGSDAVAIDRELNALIFQTSNFSQLEVEKMLALYDVPLPEVKISVRVYELQAENDDKIGVDFQAWKNNDGMSFFSAGGRYRDNWSASYSGGAGPDGSERTSFFNFNPKWNSRYFDFLSSVGRAEIICSGTLYVRNNTGAELSRLTRVFYMDKSTPPPDADENAVLGWARKLASLIPGLPAGDEYEIGQANQEKVEPSTTFGFTLKIGNASVTRGATLLDVEMSNSSLIGFESSGAPRIGNVSTIRQQVLLANGVKSFVLGGVHRDEVVRSATGVPFFKDIPYLGWLFSTESTSVKRTRLVLVADCEFLQPRSGG